MQSDKLKILWVLIGKKGFTNIECLLEFKIIYKNERTALETKFREAVRLVFAWRPERTWSGEINWKYNPSPNKVTSSNKLRMPNNVPTVQIELNDIANLTFGNEKILVVWPKKYFYQIFKSFKQEKNMALGCLNMIWKQMVSDRGNNSHEKILEVETMFEKKKI